MPRKVNHGIDYDEDYDDYEYYDYDLDVEQNVEGPKTNKETVQHGLWRCSICTFDNRESMSSCDICGVLRTPLEDSFTNVINKTVGGRCKDSRASVMATSLFSSLPRQRHNEHYVTTQGNESQTVGNIQGHFHELHEAFSSARSINTIAPFKFDVPSPDDLVTNGKNYSKMVSKVNSIKLSSTDVPSSTNRKNTEAKMRFGSKNSDGSSVLAPTSKFKGSDGSSSSSRSEDKPQSSTNSSNKASLNIKSGYSNDATAGKANSLAQYKPENWMLPEQADGNLTQLNLAIVGHVDSGKSTLSGRLLHLLGRISQKEMHKYEKEAKSQGKGSFAYAWALDESTEERERGITMTVAVAYFDSKKYHVVVLDSPGHKDFVPNLISGATQADAAILVIDASIGSFEAGMDSIGGQTREHAQLIRSFGVDQILVAVNKMDVVEYSKDRFDSIKVQVQPLLHTCGFKDSFISWVPLSAMHNQNLVALASEIRLTSWYKGTYLLEAIDALQPPKREFAKPLLMPICDVVRSQTFGQVSACGKLEAGALRSGFKVTVMPSGDAGMVKSLERDSQSCAVARAGDNVAVILQGIDTSRVMAGGVLCHPQFPVAVATHLELKVLTLDLITPILIGSQIEFHIHHAKEAARVVRIPSLLDPKTGKVTKKTPRCLTAKQSAVLEVMLNGAVCVEEFANCRALGRVFLRSSGRTIAVGIVTRIIN